MMHDSKPALMIQAQTDPQKPTSYIYPIIQSQDYLMRDSLRKPLWNCSLLYVTCLLSSLVLGVMNEVCPSIGYLYLYSW